MDKILVLYSSRDGQTRKIVDVMLEEISGCEVVMQDLHTLPMCNLSKYAKVLIGASIRYGNFHPSLLSFIHAHHEQLEVANAANALESEATQLHTLMVTFRLVANDSAAP